ncbi:MAG TPA: IucA/IucC family protein [Oxalicibacterium sp.]|uniref:IucA/IucC family protein n=1 Tax=Oxalicibacterium sp. TaxID=2766525 RepID=UPI002B900077|nr:IucA/IucC family protein [Oxalicibacterium sp.]HWU97129.1 IucA/IucC family protein [Oxalicibacterium sp.]
MFSHLPQLDAIDRRLVEQYLNIYCRETGCVDPRIEAAAFDAMPIRLEQPHWKNAGLMPFMVRLDGTDARLAGAFTHFSSMGYHRIAPCVWIDRDDGQWSHLNDAAQLSDLIATELAAKSTDPTSKTQDCMTRLQSLMRNSIAKVRRFHDSGEMPSRSRFMASEQGLRFGHVFHVTSKASEGFSDEDLANYAPELGASFKLFYFAVASDLLDTRGVGRKTMPVDSAALEFAADLLVDGEYRLLPCHPWQAKYLLAQPDIQKLLKAGEMVALGPQGETAWPTSSVRTVWLPRQNLFLKLSLNIRITNFIRNNPDEHVKRALDASQALGLLPLDRTQNDAFYILPEIGSQTIKVKDGGLRAASSVIYRQAMTQEEAEDIHVVAALLEESADGDMPLHAVLRQAAGNREVDQSLIEMWWRRYLDVTLMPLVRLFFDYGISLEAHLQNTMVGFADGWPARGYARDMEGTSISRERFPFLDRVASDSPALYGDEEAWHRFQYYVLVNHVGHVVACLGRLGICSEDALWKEASKQLAALHIPLVNALLDQPTLPAKANMLSSFHQHGEAPAWIFINNPLKNQNANEYL